MKNRAKIEEAQRLSRTKIAKNEQDEIVGFYSISPATISKNSLAAEGRGVLYEEIPAIRIGRLAVDVKYQRNGFGKALLRDALILCLIISDQFGGRLGIVDAKDDQAVLFYKKFGFKTLKTNPYVLILKISTIQKSLD